MSTDDTIEDLLEYWREGRLHRRPTLPPAPISQEMRAAETEAATGEAMRSDLIDAIRTSSGALPRRNGLLLRSAFKGAVREKLVRAQECALDEFFGLQTLDMQLLQVPRAAGLNAFGLAFGSAAANALSRAVPLCDFGRLGLRLIDVVSPLYELRFLPRDVRLGATVLIAMGNDFGEPPARIAVGFSRSGRAPRTWYSRLEAHEADLPNDHVLRAVGVPFAAERWSIVSHWVALPEQSVERYG